jgi:hypothetical protein
MSRCYRYPGSHRHVRSHPAMVSYIRSGLCQPAATPSAPRGHVASGRDVSRDSWRTTRPVAGTRSGGCGAGFFCAEPSEQDSREEVPLPVAPEINRRAPRDHHGHMEKHSAAKRELLPGVEHRQHHDLDNRAERSHQPMRQRERRIQGFKSPGHAQRFLSTYGPIAQHFRPRRHRLAAPAYRQEMSQRFDTWRHINSLPVAA